MKVYPCVYSVCLCLFLNGACDSSGNRDSSEVLSEPGNAEAPLTPAPVFNEITVAGMPDAMIDIYSPTGNEDFGTGKVPFSVNIRNYPLGKERPFMLSLNGGTPRAHSTPSFSLELKKGSYRAVTFLLDEQGLALKEYGNFSERQFTVGGTEIFTDNPQPSLLLHLPGDQQLYEEGEPVLIDFIYLGGDPEIDGVTIQIELGGVIHRTQKMSTLSLSGLPKGNHELSIRLLETENDHVVQGDFTSITRSIHVE